MTIDDSGLNSGFDDPQDSPADGDVVTTNALTGAAVRRQKSAVEKRLVWITVAVGVLTLVASAFVVWSVLDVQELPQTALERELAVYETAVAENPNSPAAHVDFGAALYESGREADGLRQLEIALKLEPNNYAALFNVAVIHWEQGKRDRAIKELKDLAARGKGRPDSWFRLGSYQQELRQWEDAITSYEWVLKLTEGDVAARYRMGVCLEELDRTDEAVEQYKATFRYVAGYEPATRALERLGEQ